MDFSFVVPTYNEEKYIANCLQSIKAQQYERSKFEIIVSDAVSTDKTIEIANQIADKVVINSKRGIAVGRNYGAKTAKGNVLIFVDADATLSTDFLSHISNSFKDKNVVCVTGIAYPSDGGIFQRFVYYVTYFLVRLFNFVGLSLFPGVGVAYRREVFELLGGFREDFGIVEDLDLSRRASRIGKCCVNRKAKAFVSTRRLAEHPISYVLLHLISDVRYLIKGTAISYYPKVEEVKSWKDILKLLKSK